MTALAEAIDRCAPLATPVLSLEEASATATLFAALGNATRVRLVNLLAGSEEPVCFCNLAEPVGLAPATVSEHLKKLVEAGLLLRVERGKWAYYSINHEAFERVATLADLATTHEGG
jgi:ArsR family transcriptional regulator, arsenate/arsenite/antimonite-responsive transcriptional repressor